MNRKELRAKNKVFQHGKMLSFTIEKLTGGLSPHVLAFLRYTKKEMAIIVINFSEKEVETKLSLKNIRLAFKSYKESIREIGLELSNWSDPDEPH